MNQRIAVPLAVLLLLAAGDSPATPKAQKKKAPDPVPSAVARKVDTPKPAPVPDNVPLPSDNGVRAKAGEEKKPVAPPPAPEAALPNPSDNAAAAMGNDAEYNRRLHAQAVRMGLLKPGSSPSSLTPEVMNRMIDAHVLKDAIRHGLLPADAKPAQVTPAVRAKMKKGGYFVHYYPDGSVNPNYGGR